MRIIRYSYPTARNLAPAFGYSGRSPWTGLENEIGRWLESAVPNFGTLSPGAQFPVDLYQDKDNAYVRAELPGVVREDIAVEVVDGSLKLSAARKQKTGAAGEADESVSFSRSITIPDDVESEKVSAAYENGVLTVTLPKREEAKPKKVAVQIK